MILQFPQIKSGRQFLALQVRLYLQRFELACRNHVLSPMVCLAMAMHLKELDGVPV
jgi:hypothetical protein